jgi:hypothetical protein
MTAPNGSTGERSSAVINGQETATAVRTLDNYIGGRWVASSATKFGEVRNPANDELLAKVPMGGAADVDRAVKAALAAYPAWRTTPPVGRVKYLFQLKQVMEREAEELARIVTREHGKTIDESRSSVRRAIDNVDIAIGDPAADQGTALEGRRARHRLPHRAPADGRVRRDHAVQLPGDGADVVPAARDRVRQHVHRQAERARAALADDGCSS